MQLANPPFDMTAAGPSSAWPVRRAVLADLDELVALEQCSFRTDRISRAQYRRHLDSTTAQVLIVRIEQQIAGSAVLFFRRGSGIARLYSLATSAETRGRGVAAALLAACMDASAARGGRALRLEVRADNAAAIRLYERSGFTLLGTRENYYEDGTPARRYERVWQRAS